MLFATLGFAKATSPMTNAARKLVMIVEDDADTRDALRDIMATHGFETIEARNGREALAMLRDPAVARPAVIILDLWMPEFDGWKFRDEQTRDPDLAEIPVVVVTASEGADRKAERLRPAAFIPKPVDVGELMQAVGLFAVDTSKRGH